jgi:hypothetical protein
MARPTKTWENEPSEDTPLNASGLNDLEDRHFSYVEQRANHTIGAQAIADADKLGDLVSMVEIFDANGVSLGYAPIYTGQVGTGGGGTPAAFPNQAVFETATRANGALSAGEALWVGPLWTGQTMLDVISNEVGNGTGTDWEDAVWNVTYGPGMEIYATAKGGLGSFTLWTCLYEIGVPSGYALECAPDGGTQFLLNRYDDGTPTQIGAAISNPSPGFTSTDSVGYSVSSGVITIYRKISGGSWTQIAQRTDPSGSPLFQGRLGLEVQGTRRIDDIGGGGIVIDSGGGAPPAGTLLFESAFNTPFPDGWSWSYVQANADGDFAYPTSTIESSWQGATNVAKFETTTAGLALSPPRKHAKVYKGFVFPGGTFDAGTPDEVALINGVYRARFWLPLTYSVPAGQVGSNIFQFKEKLVNQTQNPHTFCYTWNAADVGLNPSLGPALYVNNGVNDWQTTRRTQLPLGTWFEIKVAVTRGDALRWYLNDILFATVPSSEKTIGVASNLSEWIWGVGNYVETIPNAVYVDRAWKMTT